MKKNFNKIIALTIALNLISLSSTIYAQTQNSINENNIIIENIKTEEKSDIETLKENEEGKDEQEKLILEIEEKIKLLKEKFEIKEEIKEEEINEINLLIGKISETDIQEKYKNILSDFEEELSKDNSKNEEDENKNEDEKNTTEAPPISPILEEIKNEEKIDTEEKLKEAINSDAEEIVISGEISITSPLEINRNIKITGLDENSKIISNLNEKHIINITNGTTEFSSITIDGNNQSALINSTSEDNIIFNNCNIVNAKSILEGAAISTKGSIEFNDSRLNNNKNIAISGNKRPEGGIISSKNNKEIIIKRSIFEENTANYSSGMMYLLGDIEIENSTFKNNYSSNYGGVLDLNGIGNINNSTFKDNKVNATGGHGGAIYLSGGGLNISKSTFDGGEANMGGHINLNSNTDLKVNDSIFKNADIRERGSSILIHDNSNYEINNSTFMENKMLLNNGGTFQAQNATGSINNCHFEKNKNGGGGAIKIYGGSTEVVYSEFNENYSIPDYIYGGGKGAAINVSGGNTKADLNIEGCNFNNNYTKGYVSEGGAIYLDNEVNLSIKNSDFNGNYTIDTGKENDQDIDYSEGGAIRAFYSTGIINLENIKFENNKSGTGGAVSLRYDIAQSWPPVQLPEAPKWTFNNITFKDNSAIEEGGSIYLANGDLDLINSNFENNSAKEGGAIFAKSTEDKFIESRLKLNIFNSNFNANEALDGGAIELAKGYLSINKESTFTNNKAEYGGAISFESRKVGKLKILDNTKFDNNYSDRIGTLYIKTKDSKDYWNVNIDKNVVFSNNKIKENRRFINGFSEDKYKEYKDDLTKNIKTISSSLNSYPYEMKGKKEFQQTPFNNIDINILDYEYFISHNNPEGMKGYHDVEVYKGEDQGELKFKNDTILEGEKFTETEKQKIKATLNSYSLNRYDKLGEIVSNDEDDFKINSNDIDINGIWDIEILDREPLEEKIDIKFNANGGIVNDREIDIIKIDKGSRVESQKATRDGYKFLGWFTNLEDEKAFDFKEIINEDLELFAKWEKIEIEEEIPSKPNKPKDKEEKEEDKEKDKDKEEDKAEVKKDDIVVGKISERLNRKDHMRYLEGYPDETIKPNGDITREEVSAVLFRLLDDDYRDLIRCRGEACPLYDVHEGRWSKKHINTMINGNIVKGSSDGKFYPDRAITRAELITMIDRLDDFKYTDKTKEDLKDIKGHWAEKAISSGIQKGWVIGFEDDTFKPDDELTRAEFTVIMNRILGRLPDKGKIPENIKVYKDLDKSDWYYYDFVEACNCHIHEYCEKGNIIDTKVIITENEM